MADNGEQKANAAMQAEITRLRARKAQLLKEQDERRAAARGPALLEGRDREEMDRAMGLARHTARGPGLGEDGAFTLGTETPSQLRARLARSGGKVA